MENSSGLSVSMGVCISMPYIVTLRKTDLKTKLSVKVREEEREAGKIGEKLPGGILARKSGYRKEEGACTEVTLSPAKGEVLYVLHQEGRRCLLKPGPGVDFHCQVQNPSFPIWSLPRKHGNSSMCPTSLWGSWRDVLQSRSFFIVSCFSFKTLQSCTFYPIII